MNTCHSIIPLTQVPGGCREESLKGSRIKGLDSIVCLKVMFLVHNKGSCQEKNPLETRLERKGKLRQYKTVFRYEAIKAVSPHMARYPPSTNKVVPVIKEAESLTRKTTAPAMSPG